MRSLLNGFLGEWEKIPRLQSKFGIPEWARGERYKTPPYEKLQPVKFSCFVGARPEHGGLIRKYFLDRKAGFI